ncbi:MAG: hypothetical protein AB7G12_16790 [Thermoanaerobaculia bacterium]
MLRILGRLALVAATASSLSAQQVDMAALQRWAAVKVVSYQIVGTFDGWTQVSTEKTAEGNVKDSVTLSFDWDVGQRKILGEPKIANSPSTVGALRDKGQCTTPVLRGKYEQLEATRVTTDEAGRALVTGTRTYPEASVASECPASKALLPAAGKQESVTEYLVLPDPRMMATAGMDTGTSNLTFTPDRKSYILKTNGWSWKVTPTPR